MKNWLLCIFSKGENCIISSLLLLNNHCLPPDNQNQKYLLPSYTIGENYCFRVQNNNYCGSSNRKHIDLGPYNEITLNGDFVKVADTKDIQPSHMRKFNLTAKISVQPMLKENTMLLAIFAHMKAVLQLMVLQKAMKLNVPGIIPNLM